MLLNGAMGVDQVIVMILFLAKAAISFMIQLEALCDAPDELAISVTHDG